MKTEIATIEQKPDMVVYENGSPLLQDGMYERMYQLANMMATAKTLPGDFHGKPGDCLRVIELAHRMHQSPFALADWCFVIGGKLGMEGKGIAALINSSKRIAGSLNYKYSGDKSKPESYTVTVIGRLSSEAEDRTVEVSLKQGLSDSKGARARWEKDPDQMLAYYGARVWARRHAPEVIGGLYSDDELQSIPQQQADNKKPPMKDVEPIVTVTVDDQLEVHIENIQLAANDAELKRAFADAYKFARVKAPNDVDNVKSIYEKRKEALANFSKLDEHQEWLDENAQEVA